MALGDLGADRGVRPLDLVVDRLADVVEQAAHLGDLDVGPDLGRDDRREAARLDDVVEHVLAVARAVLEPAEELDDLRRQAGHAGVVGGLLARLADHEVDLGAGLGDDLLDPSGVDPAVADELGDRQPGDLAADRVEAADRTTVSGVSSMIRSTPVACSRARMLRPSRPMIRPFISSDGRWIDRHGVLGGVIRGDPLDGGDDDVARLVVGLLAGRSLDRPGELDGVVLGLLADGVEEDGLGVLGRTCR